MSKWISVEDETPNYHKDVLAWGSYVDDSGDELPAYYLLAFHDGLDWYAVVDIAIVKVTHWMPLPEPVE